MSVDKPRHGPSPVGLTALLVLIAAGLVLATSSLIDYPAAVLNVAWLIALAGLATVVVFAWRRSRHAGGGVPRSVGSSLQAAGRFVRDFF